MAERSSSSSTGGASDKVSLKETFGLDRHPMTSGKWVVLIAAVAMIGVGALLATLSRSDGWAGASDKGTGDGGGSSAEWLRDSFTQPFPRDGADEGGDRDRESASDDSEGSDREVLSPMLLKGGFGMFIGFAIGFAIRAFVRLAILIVGVYFLALTLMAYAGWVEIHWDVLSTQFDQIAAKLREEFSSFRSFLSGSIPASGMTALGFVVGLKKK